VKTLLTLCTSVSEPVPLTEKFLGSIQRQWGKTTSHPTLRDSPVCFYYCPLGLCLSRASENSTVPDETGSWWLGDEAVTVKLSELAGYETG
jgi:hypothetical protein